MWLLDIQSSKVYTPETKTNKCSACILLPERRLQSISILCRSNWIWIYEWKMNKSNFTISGKQNNLITRNLFHLSEGNFTRELLLIQSFHDRNTASFPHLYFLRLPRIHPCSSIGKHHSTTGLMPGSKTVVTRKIMFIALPHIPVENGIIQQQTLPTTHTDPMDTNASEVADTDRRIEALCLR